MKKAKKLPPKAKSPKTIYVLGNPLVRVDSLALEVAKKLEKEFPRIRFIQLDPNEEISGKNITILDTATGITKVTVINDMNQLELGKIISPHDYDIAFSLKLMKKIGMVKKIRIIAIPIGYSKKMAYDEIKRLCPLDP